MIKLRRWLPLLAGLALLWLLLGRVAELKDLAATLADARPAWLLLAVGLQLAFQLSLAGAYQAALEAAGARGSLRAVLEGLLAGIFAGVIAPSGGASGSAVLADRLRREGQPAGRTLPGILLGRTLYFGSFWLILAVGLAFLFARHDLQPYEALGALALSAVVFGHAGLLALGLRSPEALRRGLSGLERGLASLAARLPWLGVPAAGWSERTAEDLAGAAEALRGNPRGVASAGLVALAAHLLDLASLWAIFQAFGQPVSLGVLTAGFAMGVLFWIVTITPQGVGVVEGTMLLVFSSLGIPTASAAAVALTYRGLSFWLPLAAGYLALQRGFRSPPAPRAAPLSGPGAASTATASTDAGRVERQLGPGPTPARQAPAFSAGRVGAPLSVRTVAGVVGAVGTIDLLSAMTPPLAERLARLEPFLPLAIQQGARLTSAISGFALMVLATSLWRRKRVARWITLAVLLTSSAAHLVKGLDYEEAALGLVVALWLWSLREDFVAHSDSASVQRALRLAAAAAGFTLVYGSLGFYLLDRHYQVHFDLRTAVVQTLNMFARYQNTGLVPLTGFGRYFAGSIYLVGAATLLLGLLLVLRPVIAREPSSLPDRQRARAIVEAFGRSPQAAMALLPDKRYHFSEGGSVVAYVVRGPVALALGDPIGPGWDAEEAVEAFGRHAAAHGWMPAWYETGPERLECYRALGYQLVCLGHEAIVDLRGFSLEGGERKDLRTKVRRVARDGYQARLCQPPHPPELLAELRAVSDEWLGRATGREKAFSLGWFDEVYLNEGTLIVVHDAEDQVMAFANLVPECQLNELTIDLMRHREAIVPNTMLFLFTELMLWGAEQGFDSFNLGMAPLYGVGAEASDPALDRALKLVFERGGALYSFKGLASFKSRFHPGWTPRYLAYPGRASLPAVAVAMVRAISGDDFAREMMKDAIPLDRLARLFGDRAPSSDADTSSDLSQGDPEA